MCRFTNIEMGMMNQLMLANQNLNYKDVEIANVKSQRDILKNALKTE